ncbi:6238_t:CDS:2, partial [Gigaspora rosea]
MRIWLKDIVEVEYLEQWLNILKDKADNKENELCELKMYNFFDIRTLIEQMIKTCYTISELDNILSHIRNITEEKKHKIIENNTKKYKIHCIDELIKVFSCPPSIRKDIFPVRKNLTNLKNFEQDVIQLPITSNVSGKFLFSDSVKDSLHDFISESYSFLKQDNRILNDIFKNEISDDEIQSCGNDHRMDEFSIQIYRISICVQLYIIPFTRNNGQNLSINHIEPPEHQSQCSHDRKNNLHKPPYSYGDTKVPKTVSRKVDIAIAYTPKNDPEIILYKLICEAKRPIGPTNGDDYDKLTRSLNDAYNSIVKIVLQMDEIFYEIERYTKQQQEFLSCVIPQENGISREEFLS